MKSGLTDGISSQLAGVWAHRPSLTVTESRAQAGGCAVPVGISMSICYLGGEAEAGARDREIAIGMCQHCICDATSQQELCL